MDEQKSMSFDEYIDYCFGTAVIELKLSKEEFLDLTPYEFSVLVLHHKKNLENEYTLLRNTIYNAHVNLNRKKGDKEIPLFDERNEKETDKDTLKNEREALFSEAPK